MASSGGSVYPDLIQTTEAGEQVQQLARDLPSYFRIEDIAVARGYSKVQCVQNELQILNHVREKFKEELRLSKKIFDILQTIIPSKEKKYYITFGVRLLVFQSGLSNLEGLVGKDDCIILIPVVINGPATATLREHETERQTTFEFEVGLEFILSGQCSMDMEPEGKAVCVVLSIGRNKE